MTKFFYGVGAFIVFAFFAFIIYGWITDCPNVVGYHNKAYGCNIR